MVLCYINWLNNVLIVLLIVWNNSKKKNNFMKVVIEFIMFLYKILFFGCFVILGVKIRGLRS